MLGRNAERVEYWLRTCEESISLERVINPEERQLSSALFENALEDSFRTFLNIKHILLKIVLD